MINFSYLLWSVSPGVSWVLENMFRVLTSNVFTHDSLEEILTRGWSWATKGRFSNGLTNLKKKVRIWASCNKNRISSLMYKQMFKNIKFFLWKRCNPMRKMEAWWKLGLIVVKGARKEANLELAKRKVECSSSCFFSLIIWLCVLLLLCYICCHAIVMTHFHLNAPCAHSHGFMYFFGW